MGVVISKGILTPLSIAAITIGFISFAFTVFTFLRVFWTEIDAILSAPQESKNMLGNLRFGLYEERDNLKHARRRCPRNTRRGKRDELSLRIMQDSVRDMLRMLKKIEKHFIEDDAARRRRRDSFNSGDIDSLEKLIDVHYKNITLKQRWIWTNQRSTVKTMLDALEKLQVRRIAWQVDCLASDLREGNRNLGIWEDIEDTVGVISEKLDKVVGVRVVR